MLERGAWWLVLPTLSALGCGEESPSAGLPSGSAGTTAGVGGASGGAAAAASNAGGSAGSATGGVSAGSSGSTTVGGATAGAGGSVAGAAGAGAGVGGAGGNVGAGGSVNHVPADYEGAPFAALKIPGKINAADYDRGGASVAWCHDPGNCSAGTVTGDYPGGSGPYRPAMPADAKLCSGAACDDNVGVCRMNPSKPDNTIDGQPMPATDTYLCYSVAGEWTKYTVVVAEAGTYSVGGVMAVPQGGAFNLSFSGDITTGNVPLVITSTEHSGSGESYHSWDDRKNLATVTFAAPGTYVMTLTQLGRFNAASFTFTK